MMQSLTLKRGDKTFTPPSYAAIYNISTQRQQNDKGTWHNLVIERVGMVEDPKLFAAAKAFRHMLVEGDVALDYSSIEEESEQVMEGEEVPSF